MVVGNVPVKLFIWIRIVSRRGNMLLAVEHIQKDNLWLIFIAVGLIVIGIGLGGGKKK